MEYVDRSLIEPEQRGKRTRMLLSMSDDQVKDMDGRPIQVGDTVITRFRAGRRMGKVRHTFA